MNAPMTPSIETVDMKQNPDALADNMAAMNLQSGNNMPASSSASLYVGELHADVNEAILFELFNQVGPVASIRVCRDSITRRSLGYAYVNFHNAVDAERALDALNYHVIKGIPCRIMWSQRDPSLRRAGNGNIFIKNLDKSIDNKALHDTFSSFGNILSCKVVTDENGSKGYAYVHYEHKESAEKAIEKVNGMLLNDQKVFVGLHKSRRERESKAEEMKARFTNVYIKNLDLAMNDAELKELFESYGEITSAVVQRDDDGTSKGFGFVNFSTHDAAQAAVNDLTDKEVRGRVVLVCRAQSKSEREDELRRAYEAARNERLQKFRGVNLYVKNLDPSVDDEILEKEFALYGGITSCKVMKDDKGISKGFGFVCFSTPEETQKALAEMNGKMVQDKPLYVALAQRKEDRQALLQQQYIQRSSQFRMMNQYYPMAYPPMMGGYYSAPRPRFDKTEEKRFPRQRPSYPMSRPSMPLRRQGGPMSRPMAPYMPLTAQMLSTIPQEHQKQVIGERLLPFVASRQPSLAPKVTGMLLEMDNDTLLSLMETPDLLFQKVDEAIKVLNELK